MPVSFPVPELDNSLPKKRFQPAWRDNSRVNDINGFLVFNPHLIY